MAANCTCHSEVSDIFQFSNVVDGQIVDHSNLFSATPNDTTKQYRVNAWIKENAMLRSYHAFLSYILERNLVMLKRDCSRIVADGEY